MSDSEPESNWWTELNRDRSKPKFKFNGELFQLMVHEVFLPKKLPDHYDAMQAYHHESLMLALMADIIQDLSNELPKSTHNLFQTWSFLQCRQYLEVPETQNAIASLQSGEMIALYIREQNCGFCLYIPRDRNCGNKAIVSAFPASLENSIIMSSENDPQMSFPAISLSIPFDNFVKSIPFAEQLALLDQYQFERAMPKAKKSGSDVTEIRDVADPMYVSKWLLAFLTNEDSNVVTGHDFPRTVKKVRDDVIFKGGDLPYRRSGLWMTMKVALRLNLETEFERDKANCIYKIIQIHLTSKMCEYVLSSRTIDASLAMEMVAKVARRLDKLATKLGTSLDKFDFESLYRSVTSNSKDVIFKVRERVNEEFIKLSRLDRLTALLKPLDDINFQRDSIHKIPSLKQYLGSRVSSTTSSTANHLLEPQLILRHRVNSLDFPNFDFLKISTEVNTTILLADVERWIWENCSKCTAEHVLSLRDLAVNYGTAAKKYYVDDPLGGSRMILTILQIIRALDEIATDEYSLLEEHHSGINPKIIEDLLLPTREQLKVASGLEIYFKQRNSETSFPALNAESTVSKESFASRYAQTNPEMTDLLQTILDAEEERIEAKMLEVSKARMKIEQWKKEAKNLQHDFIKIWATVEYRTVHNRHCKLCKLQKNWTKCSVEIYERSISRDEDCQYAIAFELLIPTEISCLRDVLQFAAEEFFFTSSSKLSIRGDWINYEQIACHKEEWERRVNLGSSCILFMKSHYTKKLHADSDDKDFVVNNGYNCVYYASSSGNDKDDGIELANEIEKQTIKRFCTFNVDPESPYRNLQWTLSSTNHSQNEVLASQSSCPMELNLSEYVAFGSLRSDGCRLQMRNIYRALATETLSFEKQSVAALVFQALWQAGPKSENHWLRESYEDLADDIFASEMLDLLSKYLSLQQHNWKHPLKVMVAILIVVRIVELNDNDSIVTTAVNLLLFSRSICDDWMNRIQKAKSECDFKEQDQIQSLRTNMVDAGICCALTFAVNPKSKAFPQIWQSITTNSAIYYWLSAVVNVNNNIILSTMENSEFDRIRRTFLRQIWVTGVNSEKLLLQQVTKDCSTDVNRFVASQWTGVRNGVFTKWSSFPEVQQVVHTELVNREEGVQTNYVQIDIIAGTFLVNGMPISNLPDSIVNNDSFKRTFGSTCFEVQPNHSGIFCTRYKYNDCSYHFKLEKDEVIVKEVRTDGDVYELIPINKFGKDIPYVLQHKYSHWWNQKTEVIEFRPLHFNVHNFASSDQIQFELNLDTKLLLELKTSRCVIDRLSSSFVKISQQLARLESEKYIIAVMDGPDDISIELPRMRIQFKLGASNEIMSHEYVGMKVCSDQKKFGTLFGLRNGLLLEHQNSREMLVIMPHGKIEKEIESSTNGVNVWIATEDLRDPPFFIYDIDHRCQQLKARGSFSEWFYLAHLHAVTSQVLPDPFTGMKGTEKSLQILQSAYCWSSEPYDSEAAKTLKRIRKLSATRSYHPPHHTSMQRIKWPKNLPPSSSHEAFAIVAKRLFRDSDRMSFLHFKEKLEEDDDAMFLNERSYRRYSCYDGNAAVTKHFTKCHDDSIEEDLPSDHDGYFTGSEYHSNTSSEYVDCSSRNISIGQNSSDANGDDCHTVNIRIITTLAKHGQYHVPKNCENRLRQMLFSDTKSLQGRTNKLTGTNLIRELNSTLPDLWIDLYNIACDHNLDKSKFTLALTLLALNGIDLNDLLTLQVVAANPLDFEPIKSPDVYLYTNITEDDFKHSTISEIVSSCMVPQEIYLSQFKEQFMTANEHQRPLLVSAYSSQWIKKTESQAEAIIQLIEKQWPCDECDLSTIYAPEIHIVEVIARINPLLKRWYENRQLKLFLAEIGKKMRQLSHRSVEFERNFKEIVYKVHCESSPPKYKINFMEKIHRNFDDNVTVDDIKSADRLFRKGEFDGEELDAFWQRIKDLHLPTKESFLHSANIYPRLVPTLILPQMISSTNANHKTMIGALGVLISNDQRAARIKNLEMQPKMEVALRREKEEIPFSNWSPSVYPQWLLFQIEMDLTIRGIQVKVAKNMIQPSTNEHSVMQLNMGEGKTAVIVPILCALLSNKKHVCQVTVLKPLFESNLKSLRKCLGGMLNHRVFVFPCRRDMIFSEDNVRLLLETYKDCKKLKGIIMTLPEWRLSLQLKMYESSRKNEFGISSALLQIHKWLNKNVRNILDESDAILNAKYQLIYTVGEQLPLDGGELRWLVIQSILKIIPSNLKILWDKYGNEKIEFDHDFNVEKSSEKFCHCRILHSSVYDELQANIANDFVEERTQIPFPKLKTSEKVLVKAVLCDKYVDPTTYDDCMKIFEEYPVHQNVIFLLSGLLKFEVLHLVLRKRWRVNYGVNPNGKRKMAVPFLAKDVCAENTEFGHPDVAICFTYLSYYYSGLTDVQLLNCFDTLTKLSNGDEKYKEWISCMPAQRVHKSVRNYGGVNLSDATQRTMLFTLLRYNMNVIDFWLANTVFPREAKIFDMKMMCTAWDLCSEESSNVVTGFSGTNDTKLLLPKPICQNDLKELEDTNENVRKTIVLEENDNYEHLQSNISGLDILKKLVENRIPVLLDSGALMLELNNEQVAKHWLDLVSTDRFDAAVFFNERNILMAVDRHNCLREFDCSPYFERLDRCVVYLDDVHTRGTDLKFPTGIKACVTLSGGITRDKTVQACMRMRLLGQGHTICFWASEEADNGIRELTDKAKAESICVRDVFDWICYNSREFEKDGLVHWSVASYNYSQKLAAYRYIDDEMNDACAGGGDTQKLLKRLGNFCTDKEIIKLVDLYGGKNELSVVSIFTKRFSSLIARYSKLSRKLFNNNVALETFLSSNYEFVIERLQKCIPDMKRFSHILDEEQEKELEYELEEQREVKRPGVANPVKPAADALLGDFLRHGMKNRKQWSNLLNAKLVVHLPKALEKTSLWSLLSKNETKWGKDIYATTDFVNVVDTQNIQTDEFLRPVWWIVSAQSADETEKSIFLLMSPFEVNQFLHIFRGNASTTLRMYSPRLKPDPNINTMINTRELQMPFDSRSPDVTGFVESQLSVFAGTIYFENKTQLENYCTFLGIIPSPFNAKYQQAYDKGQISLNGFVRPQFRDICDGIKNGCPFKKNPDKLVCEIIERRHGFLPNNSHVAKIVIEGTIKGIKYGN
ncbi:uncharacterized protein LOC119073424 [Bradysia coprophila]|uniref:uncharacterized protein LOC119073424 n=1 Tax=Bradysia coprophila TaxID=38358 RepID=UPI00187DC4BD|nr:uncharacterized protein LOC119073424 [Bradysia coprophila]XP_037034764.1 uncharacterized protein LOC119073424 [Bradysia coprophila]